MKIIVDAFWDEDAAVWVASSRNDIGLVTEAATIEELHQKLSTMIPDLLAPRPGPFEVELVARSHQTIAAE